MESRRQLDPALEATERMYSALFPLWEGLPGAPHVRSSISRSFCWLVREHAQAQYSLMSLGFTVSPMVLVRPCYEALVRAIWTADGAEDRWIAGFTSPNEEAINSDGETRKGPDVEAMLDVIQRRHPEHIWRPLRYLKEATWRGMHSYVHGGVRAVAHISSEDSEHELSGALLNANMMLLIATNLVRMQSGLASAQIPQIQSEFADAFPPAH